jgi:DNA invertase Pin-like site-specific DNA recombinase
VLGYVSVASPAAAVDGQEFRKQSKIITGECKRRGLRVLELVREHEPHSGKGLGRPGLGYAFKRISTGEAQGLVVSELSRLSRSAAELGRILAWFKRTRRG